jgi:hypothetical protein
VADPSQSAPRPSGDAASGRLSDGGLRGILSMMLVQKPPCLAGRRGGGVIES